jgi:glutathione S-transferase
MRLTLYSIPGSHPCYAVEAAIELKGLAYERVDMLPGMAPFLQLARFGRRTVPGLKVDGYKVVGSPLIMRALDGLMPDPPLYPSDPARRREVEDAERWGDEELQEAARWLTVYAVGTNPETSASFLEGSNVPQFPEPVTLVLTRGIFFAELRVLGPGPDGTARWARDLPGLLDHADQLVAAGTIGGETPNAADFQVGSSIALLDRIEDLRPAIDGRPSGELARRLFPRYPGRVPAGALPADWVSAATAGHAADAAVGSAA